MDPLETNKALSELAPARVASIRAPLIALSRIRISSNEIIDARASANLPCGQHRICNSRIVNLEPTRGNPVPDFGESSFNFD